MKTSPLSRSTGYTIVELLVSAFILSIILGALYTVLTRAFATQYLVKAKGVAKEEAELALRQISRDLTTSLADFNQTTKKFVRTFKKDPAAPKWQVNIPENDQPNANPVQVNLIYNPDTKHLTRELKTIPGGAVLSSKVLSNVVEAFSIDDTDKDETVTIAIKTAVIPEGYRTPQVFELQQLATIQSLTKANVDTRWKDTKNIVNQF